MNTLQENNQMNTERIALPPETYMELVCGKADNLVELFEWAGKLVVEMLEDENMTMSDTDFLDVGCGCGRVARYLLNKPIRSYAGFDRHPGMIDWCREEIAPYATNFDFFCFVIKSIYGDVDGHKGVIDASAFQFPFGAKSFDSILLASVFTHMPIEESANYLQELHRVLKPGGKILLSVFFTDKEPYSTGIDFHYNPKSFLDIVNNLGFGTRFREELHKHNWFVLTKD